ncbi:MAG: autotransporter-associated beta strand repeat-containing protein, partial [Verrucomicrobiae bacterium]|nr:autotransporter-associated beta strand repeat-containing protein [Verrucomicrobiae bacterium]
MKPKGILRMFQSQRASLTPLVICTTLCAALTSHAADGTWTGTTTGSNWSDTANWSGGSVAGLGGTANFSTIDIPAGVFVVTVDSAFDVSALTMGDTAGADGTWSVAMGGFLTLSGGRTITTEVNTALTGNFGTQAGTDGLTKLGGAQLDLSGTGNAWAGPLAISAGTVRFKGNASSLATAAGAITGTGGLLVSQSAANTFQQLSDLSGFQGTVTCGAGAFRYGTSSAAPTAAQANGSQALFDLGAGADVFYRNGTNSSIIIRLGALTGTAGSKLSGGHAAGGGTVIFQVGEKNTDCTFGGAIIDGSTKSGLTKSGSAKLTLEGANTYNGATSVSSGTLVLAAAGTHSGTGTTTVSSSAELVMDGTHSGAGATNVTTGGSLVGTGSYTGTGVVTIASGGILNPADTSVGNLSFTNLTLASGSVLDFDFGAGNDTATVAAGSTLTIDTGATVDVGGFGVDGTYTLIPYGAGTTVVGSATTALSAVNGASGKSYTFADTGSAITMTISGSDPNNYWVVDGGDTWNSTSNWTKGTIPNAGGALAKIGPGPGGIGGGFSDGAFTIDLDGNQTVGLLAIDDEHFDTDITIDPGTGPGSLLFDNGANAAILSGVAGDHTINANVAVDAQGLAIDVGENTPGDPVVPYDLTINGVVSGANAAISKSGPGSLLLLGDNSYSGGTILTGGVLAINSATSLGDLAGALGFAGGTLRLEAELSGITRNYQVIGSANANINTNGNNFGYNGVISPAGGATGGLVKSGAGTLTLNASPTYTGATTVSGGVLSIPPGVTVAGGAVNLSATSGNQLIVDGGTLAPGATSFVGGGSAGLILNSGTATFGTGINATSNNSSNYSIILNGGTFSSSFLTMGRGGLNFSSEPGAGSTTAGFYNNGCTSTITGDLSVGFNNSSVNSSASARIDSGSLTVGGTVLVGLDNGGRWSVVDVNGGTFSSTDPVNGVTLGNGRAGSALFLVRNTGSATVEKIQLRQIATSTSTSRVRLTGGSLYIGSGGVTINNNGGAGVLDMALGGGVLGAKASWTGEAPVAITGAATIKAADAADAPFDITLSGVMSGTGDITKTGGGKLTLSGDNTCDGSLTISAGRVDITGDSGGSAMTIVSSSGATLGGNGDVGGDVFIEDNATHALAVADTAANQQTRVITGQLVLDPGNILDLTAAVTPAAGTYLLATATGGISGDLDAIDLNGIGGSVAINGDNIELTVTSGSAYDTWASGFSLTGGAVDDDDNDSVENVLEFVLGGNPTTSDTGVLPDVTVTATDYIFTFLREDDSEAEVTLSFEYGNNLSGWTELAIGIDTANSG